MGVIDTLGIADELAQGRVFTREQVERLARVSGRSATGALATKSVIDALRADSARLRTEIVNELTRTRAEVERAIAQTRSDLERSILLNRSELDVEIHTVHRRSSRGSQASCWHTESR